MKSVEKKVKEWLWFLDELMLSSSAWIHVYTLCLLWLEPYWTQKAGVVLSYKGSEWVWFGGKACPTQVCGPTISLLLLALKSTIMVQSSDNKIWSEFNDNIEPLQKY